MKPSAKSFLLDLLSTLKRGTMPVSALVEAGQLFGIGANNLRVTLARLLAAGQVARDERGRYRLAGGTVARRLETWRDLERRTRKWNAAWIGVHLTTADPKIGRTERRARKRALDLLGFQPLRSGFYVRPDNLSAGVDGVRDDLRNLGLPPSDLVFEVRRLDAEEDTAARSLWDTNTLQARYHTLLDELAGSTAHLANATARDAMVESFLVGGSALRELVRDPLLPDEICPTDDRRALLEAMKQYDRLGRAAWAEFLSAYDVPHLRGPNDPRPAVTPGFRSTDLEGVQP